MSSERVPLLRARRGSRVRAHPVIAGVASGVAAHLNVPVIWVRAAGVLTAPVAGLSIILYLWLWVTIPLEGSARAAADEVTDSARMPLATPLGVHTEELTPVRKQLLLLGFAAIALAVLLWILPIATGMLWQTVVWISLIVSGLVLIWAQVPRIFGEASKSAIAYVAIGVAVATGGALPLLGSYSSDGQKMPAGAIAVLLIAGLLLALIPVGLRAIGEVTATRTQVARETERAEIAAHLHDSVLQTLTLVRAAADDPVRVRALTLRQERELRSWLYTGQAEPAKSVAEALKQEVTGVETAYGVPIEAVTVGDRVPSTTDMAAVAAATEAMINAVRHGAPPISVYQEVTPVKLEIFVKDSGAGFSPADIPADRHGYRNSIVGRVQRAGGTVQMRHRNGTEIAISVPHREEGERS